MHRDPVFKSFYRLRTDGNMREESSSLVIPVQGSLVKIFGHETAMIVASKRHRNIQGYL